MSEPEPIEPFVPLSQSIVWDIQKRFYSSAGPRAWSTHTVPHYVTTNAKVAASYARVLVAFIEDALALGPDHPLGHIDKDRPINVIELGSGGGRLGFLLARELDALSQALDLPRFRVILTDFNEPNVSAFERRPEFEDLAERGLVDFALFDADEPAPLKLRHSGETLAAEREPNPILLVINYVIDTLRQDAFQIRDGRIQELRYRTLLPSEVDPQAPDASVHVELTTKPHPVTLPHYDDPFLDGLLTRYRDGLRMAEIMVPLGGLRAIEFLLQHSEFRGCMLVGDKGYRRLADLDRRRVGQPPKHGSFSFMANLDALGVLAERHRGGALTSRAPYTRFTMASFAFNGGQPAKLRRWNQAFAEHIDAFGPAEYHRFYQQIRGIDAEFDLMLILNLLRVSCFDPVLFARYGEAIIAQIERADPELQQDLVVCIQEVVARSYPIGPTDDVIFLSAKLLFRIRRFSDARVLFERVTREQPNRRAGWFNYGICLEIHDDRAAARQAYEKALAIDPGYKQAREGLERLKAEASS